MAALEKVSLGEIVRLRVEHLLAQLSAEQVEGLHPVILREVERALLETVLTHTAGHRERAAQILGLHRNSLRLRLEAVGLDADKLRSRTS
jgi:DNA-binding protein Fis